MVYVQSLCRSSLHKLLPWGEADSRRLHSCIVGRVGVVQSTLHEGLSRAKQIRLSIKNDDEGIQCRQCHTYAEKSYCSDILSCVQDLQPDSAPSQHIDLMSLPGSGNPPIHRATPFKLAVKAAQIRSLELSGTRLKPQRLLAFRSHASSLSNMETKSSENLDIAREIDGYETPARP